MRFFLITLLLFSCLFSQEDFLDGAVEYYDVSSQPLYPQENYFEAAGRYYNVSPTLLYSIAETESALNPNAINCANTNKSCDYGLMQINSVHLPMLKKHNIKKSDLFNPRVNIFVGAYVLKNCINKHGENYKALNCYNGRIKNNPYYAKVLKHYFQAIASNQ